MFRSAFLLNPTLLPSCLPSFYALSNFSVSAFCMRGSLFASVSAANIAITTQSYTQCAILSSPSPLLCSYQSLNTSSFIPAHETRRNLPRISSPYPPPRCASTESAIPPAPRITSHVPAVANATIDPICQIRLSGIDRVDGVRTVWANASRRDRKRERRGRTGSRRRRERGKREKTKRRKRRRRIGIAAGIRKGSKGGEDDRKE
jgi:hypothetical protein